MTVRTPVHLCTCVRVTKCACAVQCTVKCLHIVRVWVCSCSISESYIYNALFVNKDNNLIKPISFGDQLTSRRAQHEGWGRMFSCLFRRDKQYAESRVKTCELRCFDSALLRFSVLTPGASENQTSSTLDQQLQADLCNRSLRELVRKW